VIPSALGNTSAIASAPSIFGCFESHAARVMLLPLIAVILAFVACYVAFAPFTRLT
jgi:hypothetical protein